MTTFTYPTQSNHETYDLGTSVLQTCIIYRDIVQLSNAVTMQMTINQYIPNLATPSLQSPH